MVCALSHRDRAVLLYTLKDMTNLKDIAIIGAGPVGLFSVFQCGMLRMSCHVIDTLEHVGGQCVALYPEKPIYDIPAYSKIKAADLIDKLSEQAAPFSPEFHLGQQVVSLQKEGDVWILKTSVGQTLAAKAVIIAAGAGAFGPKRPPLENLEQYEGKSVLYFVRRKSDLAGKRVVIAGGGDSAVDWAIDLCGVAASIAVIHRRPKFRAAPEGVAKMEALCNEGKIELVTPYQLSRLEGANGKLSGVWVSSLENGEKMLPADVLLSFFGLATELGPIADWGLNLHQHHIEVSPETQATNIPGIFAVGDIAHYPGKLKLILCGFHEAAMAAHAAYKFVHPGEALHFEHSTSSGVLTGK